MRRGRPSLSQTPSNSVPMLSRVGGEPRASLEDDLSYQVRSGTLLWALSQSPHHRKVLGLAMSAHGCLRTRAGGTGRAQESVPWKPQHGRPPAESLRKVSTGDSGAPGPLAMKAPRPRPGTPAQRSLRLGWDLAVEPPSRQSVRGAQGLRVLPRTEAPDGLCAPCAGTLAASLPAAAQWPPGAGAGGG